MQQTRFPHRNSGRQRQWKWSIVYKYKRRIYIFQPHTMAAYQDFCMLFISELGAYGNVICTEYLAFTRALHFPTRLFGLTSATLFERKCVRVLKNGVKNIFYWCFRLYFFAQSIACISCSIPTCLSPQFACKSIKTSGKSLEIILLSRINLFFQLMLCSVFSQFLPLLLIFFSLLWMPE